MWLLIHAGLKLMHISKSGPCTENLGVHIKDCYAAFMLHLTTLCAVKHKTACSSVTSPVYKFVMWFRKFWCIQSHVVMSFISFSRHSISDHTRYLQWTKNILVFQMSNISHAVIWYHAYNFLPKISAHRYQHGSGLLYSFNGMFKFQILQIYLNIILVL